MSNLITFNGLCSNHGVVVISPISNQSLCQCDFMYTGGSDYFDTRVEPGLSLSCGSSRIGEIVLWGLVALAGLIRFVKTIKVITQRKALFKQHRKNYYSDPAFKIMAFDLVSCALLLIVTASLKIAGQVFGTDIAATILVSTLVMCFQLTNSAVSRNEFTALISILARDDSKKLKVFRNRMDFISLTSYALGSTIPMIWMLTLDKSVGPIENKEFALQVARNISIVLCCATQIIAIRLLIQRFVIVLQQLKANQLKSTKGESGVEACLAALEKEQKSMLTLFFIIGTFYLLFSLPWLWEYNTYCVATIFLFGSLRSPAKVFEQSSVQLSSDAGGGAAIAASANPQNLKSADADVTNSEQI